MGVDLRLLFDSGDGRIVDYLEMDRDSDLFADIVEYSNEKGFSVTREGIRLDERVIRATPYGGRLRNLQVCELIESVNPKEGKNRAIWEYLKNLPKTDIIWLYWH